VLALNILTSLRRMEKPPFLLKTPIREAAIKHPDFCVVIPIWGEAAHAGAGPSVCGDLLSSKGLPWGESVRSSKLGFRLIPSQLSAAAQEKILFRLSFWLFRCPPDLG